MHCTNRALLLSCCLWLCGCGTDPAVRLAGQLSDEDVAVRRRAASELGVLGAEALSALPVLRSSLTDDDREVRRLAAHALSEIGPAGGATVLMLQQALHDPELSVRLTAAHALQKLDPTGTAHVAVLLETMKMGEGGTIVAVGRMGRAAKWAVPTLIDLLRDSRAGIRRLAAEYPADDQRRDEHPSDRCADQLRSDFTKQHGGNTRTRRTGRRFGHLKQLDSGTGDRGLLRNGSTAGRRGDLCELASIGAHGQRQ